MKWFIFLLLLLNFGLWYGAGAFQGPERSKVIASGNLPRVASLKAEESVEAAAPKGASDDQSLSTAGAQTVSGIGGSGESSVELSEQGADMPALVCGRLGLIPSLNTAKALVAGQPMAGEVGLDWQEVIRELPSFHWVIIPPQPPAVALKQFRDIQRQGIDSYLVTEGENRNAISLGLFESREAAISVLEEKKRQNLNAVLANFPRNQISYALVFKAEPDLVKDVVQAVKTDYGADFDFVEINPC
ncbi:hypothetical protein [Marinobacter sediminum]|uniref:hypothetical protein n=1 Tax=Marinobacter sediminum TaxID=256323 RepID=UPI00193A00FA|nr:hypothetical protein [Marinobacter sediminum]